MKENSKGTSETIVGHSHVRLRAATACALLMVSLAAIGQGAERQTLHGHVPRAAAQLQTIDHLPASQPLYLALGLPLRNRGALTNLLSEIYDPKSTNYHRYLTVEEFTDKFCPTEQEYQAVISFAQAKGFTVKGMHPNRTLVDVEGSVAAIEKTFHVSMGVYPHPTEARAFYAPDREPSLDAEVKLEFVGGLNNLALPRPLTRSIRSVAGSAEVSALGSGSGPRGLFMGNDFRNAYAPGTALTGAGQTVALLECEGYYRNDIAAYATAAGLPQVRLENVLVDGASGIPGASGYQDWVVEVSLDIEMAMAMAPGLDRIVVYEAPTWSTSLLYDVLNRMATDNRAKQLSSSWVIPGDQMKDNIYLQFAAQGQSFFQASGDEGAYCADVRDVQQWQDSPYVTLVGGTSLKTHGPGGPWAGETVWNRATENPHCSGGGISPSGYPLPAWQQGIDMKANHGSTTLRNVPDVALTADNIYVIGNGQQYDVGGTSAAAPLWAAFAALINQQAAANGHAPVGFLNPSIYGIGKDTVFKTAFHDIIAGNNGNPCTAGFHAVGGYDLCTGWGTPSGTNLINLLVSPFPLRAAYSGLFYETNGPTATTSGSFTLNTTPLGKFSGSLVIGQKHYPISGGFDLSGKAQMTIAGGESGELAVQLQMDLSSGWPAITGTVADGSRVASLWAYRGVFDKKTNPARQAGAYTLIVVTPDSANNGQAVPDGNGYGTLTVDGAGAIHVAGSLADGTPFSDATVLTGSGQCPLYIPLNGGFVLGWMTFCNTATEDLNGSLIWSKAATAKNAGFTVAASISGSTYTAPAPGQPVLNLANGQLVLQSANAGATSTNSVIVSGTGATSPTDKNIRLSFVDRTGQVNGTASDPATSKSIAFKGVVLQKQDIAAGYFLGVSGSGPVVLENRQTQTP